MCTAKVTLGSFFSFFASDFCFALGRKENGFHFLFSLDEPGIHEKVVHRTRRLGAFLYPVGYAVNDRFELLDLIMRVVRAELLKVHALSITGFFGNDETVRGEFIFTNALKTKGQHSVLNARTPEGEQEVVS